MSESELDSLRFPIGKFEPKPYSDAERETRLLHLSLLPRRVESALQNLDAAQLATPYREGGWTVHQLVHHVADSHMHAYARVKLALTEVDPEVKTYHQGGWVGLPDVEQLPVNNALTLLHTLHERLHVLGSSLQAADWERGYVVPQVGRRTLWDHFGLYAWHGEHHVAHIEGLRRRMGW